MRAFAMTGIDTEAMMSSMRSGSLMRATPPWARMSAGTRSSAMTATAPASSAMRACSAVTTSMITPPLSISARPRLTRSVPTVGADDSDVGVVMHRIVCLAACRRSPSARVTSHPPSGGIIGRVKILSIQSAVAHGHVGNSAAVFPLQRIGVEVLPVYTVTFSNHTGYGAWRGPLISPDDVGEVITGVEERGVFPQLDAVLSGYQGSEGIADVIIDAVGRV